MGRGNADFQPAATDRIYPKPPPELRSDKLLFSPLRTRHQRQGRCASSGVAAGKLVGYRFRNGNYLGGDALANDYRREDLAMNLSNQSLLVILVVGIVAGWLAGRVMEGGGFGLIGDLIVGLIGAFIGDWLLPRLGIHLGTGIVALILNAFIGAVVLLLILRLVGGGRWGYRRWGSRW
jgi:uncharacterized membrane protein YeaQ/YmgE (transglycosylase-associated protein family)